MKIKKDHINFAVGPVQMNPEIQQLGADPVPYFRTPDFSNLMKQSEEYFKEIVGAPDGSRVVFLTGSGTAAMDASVHNLFTPEDKLLIVNGGSFGARFTQIADVYGIPYDVVKPEFGYSITEQELKPFSGKGYTGFILNMCETSTGVLYDMDLVSRFCKDNNLMLVVDAVSAFISDPLNMKVLGADVVFTGSQKALAVPPGISIVCLSPRAVKRIYEHKTICFYLDLKSALTNAERGQTPFTPAVGTLIQINARLEMIHNIGIEAEREKMERLAAKFRSRIQEYPFHIVSHALSNSVTPLSPNNSKVSAYQLFLTLKDEYGIIICPNGGEMADKIFRVGHMGELTDQDYDALFAAFDDLRKRGILLE